MTELQDWERQLRAGLMAESAKFQTLSLHNNEDVADWGAMICEALGVRARHDPPI
jgi:hypothetical protein